MESVIVKDNWHQVPFSEAVLIDPSVELKRGQPYSYIEMKDLTPNDRYARPSRVKPWSGGSRFAERDILFARITPCLENGKIAQAVGLEGKVGFGSTEFIVMRGRPGVSDTEFVHYLSISEPVRRHAEKSMSGTSGRQRASVAAFDALNIDLPPLPIQRRIADILGALDDKIECNRRINQTLEAMAQALYKHWFANSESGEIPDGWQAGKLGDIAENVRVAADPRNVPSETPYIGLEHMPRGSIALSEWGTAKDVTSNKSEFHRKQILFGKLRPYFKKVGVAPTDGVCSSDILVIQPRSQNSFGLVLCQLIQDEFIGFTEMSSGGTKMPRISWEQMARYPIAIPPENMMMQFNSQIEPWVEIIISNVKENQTLTRTRDYLLPKLLSGEVEVRATGRA